MPHRFLTIATLILSALTGLSDGPAGEAQRKPLPVIRRSDKGPTTPFDSPPLIVRGRVREQRTIEIVDTSAIGGKRPDPPGVERAYRMSLVVLRVNERLPSDPDLSGRPEFMLRETPGAELKLEFKKDYILLIKFAKVIGGLPWKRSDPDPPPYVIALPDGGFEIVGEEVPSATVRVLRRGGALARYDGKLLDDVFRLITGKSVLESDPK
jgi:hypothetical protein